MAERDPALKHGHIHTGEIAGDAQNRFNVAEFGSSDDSAVLVSRADPERREADLARRAAFMAEIRDGTLACR